MKKIIYLIGAFATAAAIFGAIAIMLNKLKISLSIESIDDTIEEEEPGSDIDLAIEEDGAEPSFDETAGAVEEALEDMLGEDNDGEIAVEITKD